MSNTGLYTISINDNLLRTLPKKPDFIDENNNITSAVFKNSKKDTDGGVSVNIEYLVLNILEMFNIDTHTIVRLSARIPLELNCNCLHDPLPENDAHALILNVTKPIARIFAKECKIIHFEGLST